MTGTRTSEPAAMTRPEVGEHQGCFVYGIVPAGTVLPDAPGDTAEDGIVGLTGELPTVMEHGDIAALVDVIDTDRALGTRADLLAYSTMLDTVAAAGTPVVPVRFGSLLVDLDEVTTELLAANHDHFAALLDELAGRVQFIVRARYHPDVALTEIVTERDDIAALREQTRNEPEDLTYQRRVRLGELVADALERKRSVDAQPMIDTVAAHAASYRVRELAGQDDLVEIALLMDLAAVPDLEAAAEALAEAHHERVRMQLRGPIAPYDFVPDA